MDPHEFLRGQKILHLATADQHGMPHVVPVWYMYRGDTIYIGTNTRTAKAVNIRRSHQAAFCVDKGIRSPLYGIMGKGAAALITDRDTVRETAQAILLRYFDSIQDPSAQSLLEDTDCIIAIQVQGLSQWS